MKTKRILSIVMAALIMVMQMILPESVMAYDNTKLVTLGSDLNDQQKRDILNFFGVSETDVQVLYVTNAEEKQLLSNSFSEAEIGSKTFSCAYIHLLYDPVGILATIGNLSKVDSKIITQSMVSAGINNAEVVTAAPFEVSGTGALTGIFKSFEYLSNETLDPVKKDIAVQNIETNNYLAEKIGKDPATVVINDIMIQVIQGGVKEQGAVRQTVDEVLTTADTFMAGYAQSNGYSTPGSLQAADREKLYDLSQKIAQTDYNYEDMKPSLQRVTRTISQEKGFDDPIIDTFDNSDLVGLPEDSILGDTNQDAMGDIIFNSTASSNVPQPEIVSLETDSIKLTPLGQVSSEERNSATSMDGIIQDDRYTITQDGGITRVVDKSGNVLLEGENPYEIREVKAGNALIRVDANAADKEESSTEDSNPLIIKKIEIGNEDYKYGVQNVDESTKAALAFDWIYDTNYHPIPGGTNINVTNDYVDFGYVPVIYEGQFGYVSGSDLTCLTDVAVEIDDSDWGISDPHSTVDPFKTGSYNAYSELGDIIGGCSAIYVSGSGSVFIIAADNQLVELGPSSYYENITPLDFGSGALWDVTVGSGRYHVISSLDYEQTWSAALMDWHGQVLLNKYDSYQLSRDGKTLYASSTYGIDAFSVTYTGNLA